MNRKYTMIALLTLTMLLLNICFLNFPPVYAQYEWPLPTARNDTIVVTGYWPDPDWSASCPIVMDWGQCMETYIMYEPMFGADVAANQLIKWLGQDIQWLDSTTIKITLRSGIYWVKITDWNAWQAGTGGVVNYRPIDAEDVKFSFYLYGAFKESGAGYVAGGSGDGRYWHMNALRDRLATTSMNDVETWLTNPALDHSTLIVHINPAYANSIVVWRSLARGYLIVPKDVWQEIETFQGGPTGWLPGFRNYWTDPAMRSDHPGWLVASAMYLPYQHRTVEWPHYTLMQKNPIWWGKDPFALDRQPLPKYFANLNYQSNLDIYGHLTAGNIDWDGNYIPYDTWHDAGYKTYLANLPYFVDKSAKIMVPNQRKWPLSETWLRKAIWEVLDFDAFNEVSEGYLQPASPLCIPADDAVARRLLNTDIENYYKTTVISKTLLPDGDIVKEWDSTKPTQYEALRILCCNQWISTSDVSKYCSVTFENLPAALSGKITGRVNVFFKVCAGKVDVECSTDNGATWVTCKTVDATAGEKIDYCTITVSNAALIDSIAVRFHSAVAPAKVCWVYLDVDVRETPVEILNEFCIKYGDYWYATLNTETIYKWIEPYLTAFHSSPADPYLQIGTVTKKASDWYALCTAGDWSAVTGLDELPGTPGINVKVGPYILYDITGWTDINAISELIIGEANSLLGPNDMSLSLITQDAYVAKMDSLSDSSGVTFDFVHYCMHWGINGEMYERYAQFYNGPAGGYNNYGDLRNPLVSDKLAELDQVPYGSPAEQGVANELQWLIGNEMPNIPTAGHPDWYLYLEKWLVRWPNEIHAFKPTSPYGGSTQEANLHYLLLCLGQLVPNPTMPYNAPTDLTNDRHTDTKDISLAGIAYGSYVGHPRWQFVADIGPGGGDGWVDIKDTSRIAKDFGRSY